MQDHVMLYARSEASGKDCLMKTLGIDLGTNSLGWAILDEQTVLKAGVLVFEEGVNREQSDSLETPAAVRRAKRMARRLRFRRHLRRRLILRILIDNNMCPLSVEELKAWTQTGHFPKDNVTFIDWLKSTDTRNPYCDRARSAAEKVDPLTLGRAIYHLAQRRGFKSGRRDQPEEGDEGTSARAKELGVVKGDIARISAELEKTGLTLGQFFYHEIKAGRKVRKQHTGRNEHYQKEWERIAKVQNLDKTLAERLARTLFWQRPLREQSFLVGKCPLEPTRNRAQIGHPEFEAFRALSFVNNIRVIDGEKRIPLTGEQRALAANCFIRKTLFDFKVIRQKLEKQFKELKGAQFNYEDSVSLASSRITASLVEILPDGTDSQKAFDALTFFDDNVKLNAWAQKNLGLSQEAADRFVKIRIPEGRGGYSLHAIRKINRFLRKGVELSEAIFLAKLPDIIPEFDLKENEIIAKVHEHNELYRENKRTAYHDIRTENRVGVLSLEKRLGSWLEQEFGINGNTTGMLYFRDPKADTSYATLTNDERHEVEKGFLPKVNLGMIRNPLVQRSMTMLRRLVNELRKKGAIDADTRIHIELARDVNSRNDRMAIQDWQKQNEKKRADARAKLQEYGFVNPADDLVLKYVLAEEQNWVCPYTGREISMKALVEGGFDIEHTIPRSRSGDDSQANKTLCDAVFNRNIKKGMMPSELSNHEEILTRLGPWLDTITELQKLRGKQSKIAKSFSKDNPEARAKARQKFLVTKLTLKYWEDKYHRFTKKPEDITPSFISRQLVDTGIMTRHAVALLKSVYADVYPVNGQAVAFARKLWKVQDEDAVKDRSDHTHHAKDAMVIAALSRDRFQKICAELKADDERKNPKIIVTPPFAEFAPTVFKTTQGVLVKHVTRHNELKQTKRSSIRLASPKETSIGMITRAPTAGSTVRGQLHKETFYGKIKKPGATETVCVIRKELNAGNFPQASALEKIIDPAVRSAIQNEIARRGGDFKKAMDAAVEEGTFKLPGERGAAIKKVRVEAGFVKNPQIVRLRTVTPSRHDYKNAYWAESGANSNFRLAVYECSNATSSPREFEFIAENLLKCVQGVIRPSICGGACIGYILPGAMALARRTENAGMPLLYKVVAFGNMETEKRITLRLHTEARGSVDLGKDLSEAGRNKAGESSVRMDDPYPLLRLQMRAAWNAFLFEGIHFKMGLDGEIDYTPMGTEQDV